MGVKKSVVAEFLERRKNGSNVEMGGEPWAYVVTEASLPVLGD